MHTEIKQRDRIDSTEKDPLKQADDAIVVDSSTFSFDEQVQYIIKDRRIYRNRINCNLIPKSKVDFEV